MSAGLNDSPKFISALGQLVWQALGEAVHPYPQTHATGRQMAAPALLAAAGD